MTRGALLLLVVLLSAASSSVTASCLPRLIAPGKFINTPKRWGSTDSGPILTGFVDLRSDNGLVSIEHGIDLSHHNANVPYDKIRACGATFAIVKMDDAFARHAAALRSIAETIVPYSYLSVADRGGHDYKRFPRQFSLSDGRTPLSDAAMEPLLTAASDMGRWKAQDFIKKYEQTIGADARSVTLGGITTNPIVIDVEEYFDQARFPSTETQKIAFGRFYGRMLSSWISEFQKSYPSAVIVFYTAPFIFSEYLQYAYPVDYATIHGMPVWLARTRGDGSDFDLTSDKALQRICLSASGGNKCILHQYSHRVVFSDSPFQYTKPPAHFDVDRLFQISAVKDGASIQYVRAASIAQAAAGR